MATRSGLARGARSVALDISDISDISDILDTACSGAYPPQVADDPSLAALQTSFELPRGEAVEALPLSSGVPVTSPIIVHARLAGWPAVELRLEVDGGKIVLTRLALTRSPDQPTIGQAVLRELPLSAIVKEARRRVIHAFSVLDQLGDGTKGTIPLLPAALASLRPPRESRGPGTRRVIDDELLGDVAAIVAAHPAAPTRAVQEQLGTSHRNATRWIAAARARGIEPARAVEEQDLT